MLLTLTVWTLSERKSLVQRIKDGFSHKCLSFSSNKVGCMVLNADEKSINKALAYVTLLFVQMLVDFVCETQNSILD